METVKSVRRTRGQLQVTMREDVFVEKVHSFKCKHCGVAKPLENYSEPCHRCHRTGSVPIFKEDERRTFHEDERQHGPI